VDIGAEGVFQPVCGAIFEVAGNIPFYYLDEERPVTATVINDMLLKDC
jgi:hypothetical protein